MHLSDPRQVAQAVNHTAQPVQFLSLSHIVINIVAAEEFIPAVPGERNRHMLSRQLGYHHGRDL